jgi:hypothetical protein
VRTGVHEGFLRIVFDWPRPVDFIAEADGQRLRVSFGAVAPIDAAMIGARLGAVLDAASASESDGRSELRLLLKPGVWPQVYELEDRLVVIDLYQPSHAPPTDGSLAMLPGPAPLPANPAPPRSTTSRTVQPEAATAAAELPAPAPAKAEASPLTLGIKAAKVERGVALDFVWSRPTAAAFLLRAGYLWSVFAPLVAPGEVALPSLESPAPGWLGPGERVDAAGGTALRFPLRRPVAARIEGGGARWRVILGATAAPPQAARLERLADPSRLRIITGEPARLVRLTDPEVGDRLEVWPLLTPGLGQPRPQQLVDFELLATAQGLAWRRTADQLRAEAVDGAVELQTPEGLRLSASTPASGGPYANGTGPAAERAAAPPAERPAESTGQPQLAVSAAPPPAEASPTKQAAPAIGAAELGASSPGPGASATVESAPMADRKAGLASPTGSVSPLLGLARFAPATTGSLPGQREFWRQRVVSAAGRDRPAAQLDLARFFLAHALGAEALAVLGATEPGEPAAEPALELARRSLIGAAQLLMDRPDEAAAGLEAPALGADPEAALWRAVLAGTRADWPRAAQELARSGAILDDYPLSLQFRLGLPAARIAIEADNQEEASRRLGRLQALDLGPAERDRVAFVEGLAHARLGAIDDADAIWRRLERSQDRETRIEAGFARVQMLLDAGRLSPADGLARLVATRPLWRPDPQERAMLDALARLYLQNDEPAAALHVWQEVLSHFPDAPDAARIAQAMRDSFVAALLPADGGGLGALRAYALYSDFPKLVPDGALGDRLRRRLADQLAGLDLVEQAASVLDPLLDHLKTPAKAETGAWLAELWLRAPDPTAALAALDRTETGDDLPPPLIVQRRTLRARALAASGQSAVALALLEGGADQAERRLRVEIPWDQRDWSRLVGALEDLLPAGTGANGPLAEADQNLVTRLAIAYAHQGQAQALDGLRQRFGEAMRGQPGEPAFLIATLAPARAAALEPALAAADQRLTRARAYLDSIRADR